MSISFTCRPALAMTATALLCAVGPTSPAEAQSAPVVVYAEPTDVRTERVSYRDLNLASSEGQKKLVRRVGSAVRHVCTEGEGGYASITQDYRFCKDGAWKDARPQIARAIARANEIALYGKSSIAAATITITVR